MRTHGELAAIGLTQQFLIVNGLLPEREAGIDPLAHAIYEREQAALIAMPEELQALPRDDVPLKPFNLVGLDALRQLLVGGAPMSNLTIGEPVELRHEALRTKGAKFDAQGRTLLEEASRSPCTEEIAVFQAFSRTPCCF